MSGIEVVVGTPGRLVDLVERKSLDLSQLELAVLDEADEMLDLGFRDDLEFILSAAPAGRRTLMFSATVPPQIAQLAGRFQRDALRIEAAGEAVQHEDIDYRVLLVAPPDRENAIINALLYFDADNALVFCATREAVRHLSSRLANRGFSVVSLSGELSQAERTNALQAMRDGRARVCVATDVAARGIDLPNLDLVVHADLPSNPETLLHRSGRTGRAGRKGVCALIVPYHRRRSADRLLKLAKLDAGTMSAPGAGEIAERERARILADAALAVPVAADDVDLVAALIETAGPERIAAAFLRGYRQSRPVAEELSDGPVPALDPSKGERPSERFEDGVWFSVTLGRRHRAEPRWLLPLICKAGNVTKGSVGSIRILDHETRFEIARDAADAFAAAVREKGAIEKGVAIARIDGDPVPEPARGRKRDLSDRPPARPVAGKRAREDRPASPARPGSVEPPAGAAERTAPSRAAPKETARTLKRKAKKQRRKAEGRFG
jgi:ATP-dependent RNA helicase DeaD